MSNETNEGLAGKTILISGGSRGIGLAIAIRAARDGANVAIMAKTDEPDPRLPGTVHTAAAEIEEAGGKALAVVGDVREEEQIANAVAKTVEAFGGIDIVVNNASAIAIAGFESLPVKRYDLMLDINARGTFLMSKLALPHLLESNHAHVLTLSPPLNPDPAWLKSHAPYTLSKYGMSMLTMGLAEEMRDRGIAANCLWPRTIIATAAVQNLLGGDEAMAKSRKPEIMGDAAHAIVVRPPSEQTGKTLIDDEVLAEAGVTDLSVYGFEGADESELAPDLFL
ncbi:NAD(P)-dependent oxidoreductase [soil metagenome]